MTIYERWIKKRVLITVRTYPTPAKKGIEVSCTAGITDDGKWNPAMLPKLMPLYRETFKKLKGSMSDEMRRHFYRHIASVAIYGGSDPIKEGWLWEFLSNIDDYKNWAHAFGAELGSLKTDAATTLWKIWLNKYWSERITGIPVPIVADELIEMIHWAIDLSILFPDIVDKICLSPAPSLGTTNLYRKMNKMGVVQKYPSAVTKLLLHLLPIATQPFWYCKDIEDLVKALIASPVSRENLHQLCNHLAKLGCSNAGELDRLCNS
jgi:hypothetical protein